MGNLEDGMIVKSPGGTIITAEIVPNPVTAPLGGFVHFVAVFNTTAPISESLLPGSRGVAAVVPEPTTLCLLGTSVIGLAGMVRRRLKLGR